MDKWKSTSEKCIWHSLQDLIKASSAISNQSELSFIHSTFNSSTIQWLLLSTYYVQAAMGKSYYIFSFLTAKEEAQIMCENPSSYVFL